MAKDFKTQTGGLQEKKVKVPPTKEEIKADKKAEKEKRREQRALKRKDRPSLWARLRDMLGELRKVRWPSFGHTLKQTGIVLGVVLIFSLVIFGLDSGLVALYKLLIKGLA